MSPPEAGRELDEKIATHVMGLRVMARKEALAWVRDQQLAYADSVEADTVCDEQCRTACAFLIRKQVERHGTYYVGKRFIPREAADGRSPEIESVPWYSDNIEDAWLVVEKMREMGYQQCDMRVNRDAAEVRFVAGILTGDWIRAATVPLAICLAALEVVGVSSLGPGEAP